MSKYAGIEIDDAMVARLRRSLIAFGYTNLTQQRVRAAVDRVLAGEDWGTDVIAYIVKQQIDEAIEDAAHTPPRPE